MSDARLLQKFPLRGGLFRAPPRHGPRIFGRGPVRLVEPVEQPRSFPNLSDEIKLFAGTFAAGFLFVSLLIA